MIVRNFEYLLALHREGHFGNAAKSCNVSQPTLSAGIKKLEEDMGVEIVRHGRRYDGLTSEGMRVLSWAQQMYDDCKGLEREISALRRGIEGKFRLGILPNVINLSCSPAQGKPPEAASCHGRRAMTRPLPLNQAV
ncbi:TPA: LysR family transcriptional regulator [Pseudomonas aeruginosa]|uniref:LysR family transcriptional regulator n=1 Tax=Pseudomonas aeruginosa TaxID=287 RepID=UPI003EE04706